MGDPGKEKWDTEKMREHRNNWSLAADTQLLSYMQQFSQNLLSETHSTLKALDSLESQVATTCVEVSNIGSRFWALSDTQFVENRVYDDDEIMSPTSALPSQDKPSEDNESMVIQRLTEAIQNGVQVMDSKFETVQVPASDSDDDDDSSPHSGVVLKPVNRYKDRPLPHLIGSTEFRTDDTLGLRDAPSDEETDEFMSASDKAYDESEDSDMESDQTKPQQSVEQEGKNSIFRPSVLGLPEDLSPLQPTTVVPLPTENMFGEQDGDLFSQMAGKKPMFTNWQTSDLWAPEDETQKAPDDNSGIYRPPSADSSISSAQSSNVSEPVKKTSEDFGKSGSGRLPVFVQEEQNDLFDRNSSAQPPAAKKTIPAGGVKVFGDDINPFPGRNPLAREASDESSSAKPSKHDSWVNEAESDIFSNPRVTTVKRLPNTASASSISAKKKDVDLFGNDDSEDDLFSSSSRPATLRKNSDVTDGLNIKNNSNLQVKSQPNSDARRDNFGPKSNISPFSDRINPIDPEEDNDLFSSKGTASSKSRLSDSLFSDSLFASESDDLFSSNDMSSKKTTKENVKAAEDLFSDIGTASSIYDDLSGDLFGISFSSKKTVNKSSSQKQPNIPSVPKGLSGTLFDENEDDDLFNTNHSTSKTSSKQPIEDLLFSSKTVSSANIGSQPGNVIDDLFTTNKQPIDVGNQNVKSQNALMKPKKGLERRSLFDSDSDDDLFSSPQGSLSSRKSSSLPSKSIEDKKSGKTPPIASNKEQILSKAQKTDFSSIFSDSVSEESKSITNRKAPIGNPGDLFGEDKDLFYKPSLDLKTPDLFNNLPTKPSNELPRSNDDPLAPSEDKENIESSNSNIMVEATNPELLDSTTKLHSVAKPQESSAVESHIFDNDSNRPTKPEPPKTLNIKSIAETLSSNLPPFPKENISERTQSSTTEADIFDEDLSSATQVPRPNKPEPPKSLDIKPVVENLSSDISLVHKEKTNIFDENLSSTVQAIKPIKPELPSSGEDILKKIMKPPVSKKPSPKVNDENSSLNDVTDGEILTPTSPSKAAPGKLKASQLLNINTAALLPGAKPRLKLEQNSIPPEPEEQSTQGGSVSPDHITSESPIHSPEEDMPPKGALLQSVIKERPKFQGKRRPSSRRARQQAIRASIEVDSENSIPPTTASSNLMSPPTDEEDLFSVPPLDLITDDVKIESPTSDIFGSPRVLSPVNKQELPSSFVSTPFVHSQPPPLEEEEEEIINQDDDIFESQDNLPENMLKDKKLLDVKQGVQSIRGLSPDLFGDEDEDSLFSGIREAPPPLIDDDDEDDDDDELFMSSNIRKNISSGKNSDSLFTKSNSGSKVVSDRSLFLDNNATKSTHKDSLDTTSTDSNKEEFDRSLIIPETISSKSAADEENSLFAGFTGSNRQAKVKTSDLLFGVSNTSATEDSDESLFSSRGKAVNTESSATLILDDDSLFTASKNSSNNTLESEKSKPSSSNKEPTHVKKDELFGNNDDEATSGNLFSSGMGKKIKVAPSSKSSLFDDEDDDDDIFGSLSSNKKYETLKNTPTLGLSQKGTTLKGAKHGTPGSSKPVKLETKQAFSDPLLSNKDF